MPNERILFYFFIWKVPTLPVTTRFWFTSQCSLTEKKKKQSSCNILQCSSTGKKKKKTNRERKGEGERRIQKNKEEEEGMI